MHDHIDTIVAELPAQSRDVIVLYFFEEITHVQIAESLGVSRQVITYKIGKAVEQIRAKLSAKGITAPAATALVSLIHQNSATALPNQLAPNLGRIALGAKPSVVAKALSITSKMSFKLRASLLSPELRGSASARSLP